MSNCSLCGSSLESVVSGKDAKTKKDLCVCMCETCGLVQQSPMPTEQDLRVYYSHHYRQDYKKTYSPKLKYVFRAGMAAKERLGFLTGYLTARGIEIAGKRLLDVGAGGGEVVYAAQRNGFIASGIEPNHGYSEFARENYGVRVDTKHLDEVDEKNLDIVTMFHVLEHIASPRAVMQKIYQLLSSEGIFVVEVPNIEQADASPANIYFKAHLYYFSASTLIALASPYFRSLAVEQKGNLKLIFQKKEPVDITTLPESSAVSYTKGRLSQKGWLEYLTTGGGWKKPFSRAKRDLSFLAVEKSSPRKVLDQALGL